MSDALDPYTCDPSDLDDALTYRLLVTTCITAGTFYSNRRAFGSYTHIIVDEVRYQMVACHLTRQLCDIHLSVFQHVYYEFIMFTINHSSFCL